MRSCGKLLTNKDFSILNRCLDEFKEEVLLNEFEIAVFDLDRLRILRVSDWTSAINVCTITTAKMTPGVPLINVRIPVIDFAANKTLVLDVPSDVYAEISSFYSGKIAPEDFVRSLSDVIDAQEINAQIPPEFFRIQSH
ncbi:MAG: hypothetical protein R3C03_06870 [Pirellulaceae bacterium]